MIAGTWCGGWYTPSLGRVMAFFEEERAYVLLGLRVLGIFTFSTDNMYLGLYLTVG